MSTVYSHATSTTFECELLLDFNCDIYPLFENEKFTLVLASTLHLDGTPADYSSYVPQSVTTERTQSCRQLRVRDAWTHVGRVKLFSQELG